MIHRLLGPIRPRTRIIVFGKPATVKQAHRGAVWCWWLVASMAIFLCGFGPPRLVDREVGPTARVSVGELRVWAEQSMPPELSAESFMLFDLESGQTLYASHSTLSRAPASLTKLMTALLVLEQGDLEATMTVEAVDMAEGATMGLAVGDRVTVQELLWGLLLPSGNDAANVLARHVGGTSANFVEMMNQRAQALGLAQTHFVNPHGLDADGHVSSAEDLLALTLKLWDFPLFRTIVAAATVPWQGRTLLSTNEWLTTFDGVTGVKTGTTDNAGECLIASIERDGRTLFLVVIGSRNRYADAAALYAAYQASYTWEAPSVNDLSVFNRIYDDDGQLYFIQPAGEAPTLLRHQPGGPQLRSYRRLYPLDAASITVGTAIGELEWWAGERQIGAQPLIVR